MADIDVAAIGLASPPPEPYQQSYTPGILVRNNGVAAAVATGYLQMFDKVSGVLLELWDVSSGAISPGAEGTATAQAAVDLSAYDPGTELLFSGLVSTPGDSVPGNNPLQPVTVIVQEGESPDPPTVPAHASQHESGGVDSIDLSNLSGQLSDPQTPTTHRTSHQENGLDELDLTGLHGVLADAQPVEAHDNNRHLENYATLSDVIEESNERIANHNEADNAHAESGGLEHVSEKGQVNGYCPLGPAGIVPTQYVADRASNPHGNAQHSTDFATDPHNNDQHSTPFASDPHDNFAHLVDFEAITNKGQANGYCGLDAGALVAPGYLGPVVGGVGGKFLRGDQTWADALTSFGSVGRDAPAVGPSNGVAASAARSDHSHGAEGLCLVDQELGNQTGPGETTKLIKLIPDSFWQGSARWFRGRIIGGVSVLGAPKQVIARLKTGPVGGPYTVHALATMSFGGPDSSSRFWVELVAFFGNGGNTLGYSIAHWYDSTIAGNSINETLPVVVVSSGITPGIDLNVLLTLENVADPNQTIGYVISELHTYSDME